MILVGYCRVSSDSQQDNASLPIQREAIEKFCKDNGHELFCILDEVESGADTESRPTFQKILGVVRADLADGIVAYKQDRFSRSVRDSETIRHELEKLGKVLIFVQDPVETRTPEGAMMYQFKASFAEYERKQISARCESGRRRKMENGGYIGGNPPYGYMAWGRTLMVVPHEQEVLQIIKEMYAQGYPTTTIAKILNDRGIPSKRGAGWSHPVIYKLITQESIVIKRLRASGQLLGADRWCEIHGETDSSTNKLTSRYAALLRPLAIRAQHSSENKELELRETSCDLSEKETASPVVPILEY